MEILFWVLHRRGVRLTGGPNATSGGAISANRDDVSLARGREEFKNADVYPVSVSQWQRIALGSECGEPEWLRSVASLVPSRGTTSSRMRCWTTWAKSSAKPSHALCRCSGQGFTGGSLSWTSLGPQLRMVVPWWAAAVALGHPAYPSKTILLDTGCAQPSPLRGLSCHRLSVQGKL